MAKSMKVTLTLEFDGIENANSEDAISIIEGINDPDEIMSIALAYCADRITIGSPEIQEA